MVKISRCDSSADANLLALRRAWLANLRNLGFPRISELLVKRRFSTCS
jgi:hypothetical protein